MSKKQRRNKVRVLRINQNLRSTRNIVFKTGVERKGFWTAEGVLKRVKEKFGFN